MKNRSSLIAYFLLAVFLIGGLGYFFFPLLSEKVAEKPSPTVNTSASLSFTKEGELTLLRDSRPYKKIDIEIAENSAERNKGLMYRPYLPDSVGMLFIFEEAKDQAFWMKNTIIPLDIIYLGSDKKIISISRNTKPYSEESIPSFGPAQYVLEVNAGFSEKNDLKIGDAISF